MLSVPLSRLLKWLGARWVTAGQEGHRTTYIEAGHVHPVAHNHIDEIIWRAVFSEEYLGVEDLWVAQIKGKLCTGMVSACVF